MKLDLAGKSMLLFGVSVVLLIALALFEYALAGVSLAVERAITFFLLILPAAIGTAFGVLSLLRREGRTWLAVIGAVLNALFGLFHAAILLFAG